jgi:hypothetical protein
MADTIREAEKLTPETGIDLSMPSLREMGSRLQSTKK